MNPSKNDEIYRENSELYRKVCHETKKGQMMSRIKLDLKKQEIVAVKLKLIIL